MGLEDVQSEAAQQESLVNPAYKIIEYPGAQLPVTYRGMIFSKWLRSLRYGNDYFRLIEPHHYYKAYHFYLEGLIERSTIWLAVLSDDHDVALGFSVHENVYLHYVHVHATARRQGIGSALVPRETVMISHLTKTGLTIWANKYGHWKFNPFV